MLKLNFYQATNEPLKLVKQLRLLFGVAGALGISCLLLSALSLELLTFRKRTNCFPTSLRGQQSQGR